MGGLELGVICNFLLGWEIIGAGLIVGSGLGLVVGGVCGAALAVFGNKTWDLLKKLDEA
jgi:hypothetical protein